MKILYADDDQEEIEFFCEVLKSIDPAVECVTTTDAVHALRLLSNNLLPDIIFLDFHMPAMNGLDCLFLIKKNPGLAHIPVVIYTTIASGKLITHLKQAGAFRIINKSADIVKLSLELKKCLAAIAHASN